METSGTMKWRNGENNKREINWLEWKNSGENESVGGELKVKSVQAYFEKQANTKD